MLDPRRILQDAATHRARCELCPRGGRWSRGEVVRVERGGVVVALPGSALEGGEDVRVWLTFEGRAYTFEASALRAGVPVPDRSQDGVMLGFIADFSEAERGASLVGRTLELLPPNGPPISLLEPPARLIELTTQGASFTVPADFPLVFVDSGTVAVRLGAPGQQPVQLTGQVRDRVRGSDYLVYSVAFRGVDDPDAFRALVHGLAPLE